MAVAVECFIEALREALDAGQSRLQAITTLVNKPLWRKEIDQAEADERMRLINEAYDAMEAEQRAGSEQQAASDAEWDEVPTDAYEEAQEAKPKRRKNAKILVKDLVEHMERGELRGSIGYNEFMQTTYVTGVLPWDNSGIIRAWEQTDEEHLYAYLQEKARARDRRDVTGALRIYEHMNSFDPLRDFMLGLADRWDGTPRIDRMAIDVLGCEDSRYTRVAWATFMCGAFMRAIRPGIKFELCPVLDANQGFGKTEFCKRLAVHEDWYVDGPRDLSDMANAAREMRGKFICELGELGGLRSDRLEAVKAAISRTDDSYAEKYVERSSSHKRHGVFIGTTNRKDYLKDPTGSRRFLPFKCGITEPTVSVFSREVEDYVIQAWAELSHRYRERGNREFRVYLDPETTALAEGVRASYLDANEVADAVSSWLADSTRTRVCGAMAAREALGIDRAAYAKDRHMQHQVCDALDYTCGGWERVGKKRCGEYGVVTVWERS
jgi:predicted P-loop ATPase